MTSKFIWQIGEDWSITKVSKGNNKLFANAIATPVYAVIGNSQMLATDVVEMICSVNGNDYHKFLLHYEATSGEIIVDDEAVSGWQVVSNGEELSLDIDSYEEMTISFTIKRFSTIDGTTLLKSQPTAETSENIYPSGTYTPMDISDDVSRIEGLIAELNDRKQDKYDLGLETEAKYVTNAINEVNSVKQNKIDNLLETDSKTVVGAINEVNSKIDSHDEDIDEKLAKKVDKEVKQNDKVTQINNAAGGLQLLHAEGTTFQDLEDDQIRIEHNKITIQSESNVIGSGTIMEITPNVAKINNKKIPEALNVNSQSTQDTYSANYINEQIDTAIEVAEGKTATYTISNVTNPTFNSNNDTISLSSIDTITDILGNVVSLSDLDVGDIILVTETEVPDRWVGSIASNVVTFYKMETNKIDLSNYATKTELATKQDKLTAGTGITIDSNNVISATDQLPSHTSADVGKVLKVDNQNDVVWDYPADEFVMFTKTNSSGTFTITSAEWASAMNNDKAILRVTDGTDYYVLYKVKYDATTVYFQGDGKEAQFIKDGVNYSGTFEDASGGSSTLVGTTDPTTVTVGEVGQFYLNTTTNKLFQCQSAGGGSYTWGVPNVNAVTLGTGTQTFDGSKTLKMSAGSTVKLSRNYDNNDFLANELGSYISDIKIQKGTNRYVSLNYDNTNSNNSLVYLKLNGMENSSLVGEKTLNIPFKSGTLALTSDIPTLDSTPTQNSQNAVTSGGVYSALALKQDTLTAGTNITIDANNVISSSGGGAEFSYLTITLNLADWNNGEQTKSVSTITSDSMIWVSPTPTATNIENYTNAGIFASNQGNGTITFTAITTPSTDIQVNLIINNSPNASIIQQNGTLIINSVNETIQQSGSTLIIGGNE